MATVTTYDPRCYELAATFLSDEPDLNQEKLRHALALEIQQCIEDEIYFMRNAADLYGKPSVGSQLEGAASVNSDAREAGSKCSQASTVTSQDQGAS